MVEINTIIELIARAGGGGSGGGGGSSAGAGSESGGSDGGSLLVLAGYIPMHFVGALLRRKLNSTSLISLIGWPISVIYAIFLTSVFKGYGFIVGIAGLVGMGAGLYNWFSKIAKLNKKAKADLAKAVVTDDSWDEALLKNRATEVFMKYQHDWTVGDLSQAQSYMMQHYLGHARLMIEALKQIKRRNIVANPTIADMQLIAVSDISGQEGDTFTMAITARADDSLIDTGTNQEIHSDSSSFTEYWQFMRNNSSWKLNKISQATEEAWQTNSSLANFAQSQQFYFSPDWGWLLLPQRGQLFDKANFGRSDINNHAIGMYDSTLMQLYTYIPAKTQKENVKNYLVAQVMVPKFYGNILVRKKRKLGWFSNPKGLTKVSLEWSEFNDRYEVWASDVERVTSLELLHPAFMVKLQELPFEVNIEVVDNIVYLYSQASSFSVDKYQTMLDILKESYKQMRM